LAILRLFELMIPTRYAASHVQGGAEPGAYKNSCSAAAAQQESSTIAAR